MRFIAPLLAAAALAFPAAASALPSTTIDSGPGSGGFTSYFNGNPAIYEFSADEASTFECRFGKASLVDPEWQPCTSPANYPTPTDGFYKFQVRATSLSGTEVEVETRYFMVDRTAPVADVYGVTSGTTTPTINIGMSQLAGTSYACSIDGGAYGSCGTMNGLFSFTMTPLSEGTHTVDVKATDAAGNVQVTPTRIRVVIDLTAPTVYLREGPPKVTTATSAQFRFGANEPLVYLDYTCTLDGKRPAWWDACGAHSFTGLSVGEHVIRVVGRDDAGNLSKPFEYRWRILPSPKPPEPGPSPVKNAVWLPGKSAAAHRKAVKRCRKLAAKKERKCIADAKGVRYGAVQFRLDAPATVAVTIERSDEVVASMPVGGVKGVNRAPLTKALRKGNHVAKLAVAGKQTATTSFRVK